MTMDNKNTSIVLTREPSADKKTVVFSGEYPIGKNGFIEISDALYKNNKMKVNIKRTADSKLTIVAKMDYDLAEKWCKWKKDNESYYFAHNPWWTNEIYDVCAMKFIDNKSDIKATNEVTFRGGNRIFIDLREEAEYEINIPNDADYEPCLEAPKIESKPDLSSGYYNNDMNEFSKYVREPISETKSIMFSGTYPIGANGLIRLYQKDKDSETKVVINRVQNQPLTIIASIESKLAENKYIWSAVDLQKKIAPSSVPLPWYSNAKTYKSNKVTDDNGTLNVLQMLNFKGGNRIDIELKSPGFYAIDVPHDADLETYFESANVIYDNDSYKTCLSVDCKSVNICGDNGSSTEKRQRWDYYSFGTGSDPLTKIKTKGNVILPTKKVLSVMDYSHYMVWKKLKK